MAVFLKILLLLLLTFVPFAFGGTEPWAFSIFQFGVCVLWILYWASNRGELHYTKISKITLITLGFLPLLALVQACFGSHLLQPVVWWHPVSMMPLFTLESASVLATYWMVCWLTGQLFARHQSVKYLLYTLTLLPALVALCAWGMPDGEYIFRLTYIRGGIGPFLNRNHAAVFFALGAVLSLGLCMASMVNKYASVSVKKKFHISAWTILWGGLFLFLTFSTVFTRSRGGMLSLLIGLFCYAFLFLATLKNAPHTRKRGLLYTGILLILSIGWISTHIDQINAFTQRTDPTSTQVRYMLYQAAGHTLQQYPLWGIGLGALPVVIPAYTAYPLEQYIERLHNDWLELLISIGLIGLLPLLVGGAMVGYFAYKRLRKLPATKRPLFTALITALLVVSAASLVDFHFYIPANALWFFTCLGLLGAPTFDKHHVHILEFPGWSRVLVAILLLAALYVPFHKTLAWRSVLFSQGLKTPAKLALYRQALQAYPSPRYAVRLANACLNASAQAPTAAQRHALRQEAHEIATTYLTRYPKEPELSLVYLRSQQN